MPAIPEYIYADLGLQRGLTEAEYLVHLDNMTDYSSVPVFSQEGRECLAKSLAANVCGEIRSLSAISPVNEWRYALLQHDGAVIVELIFCPTEGIQNPAPPPTSAENLLLDAWLSGQYAATPGFAGVVLAKMHATTVDPTTISALLGTLNCSDRTHLYNDHRSYLDDKNLTQLISNSRFLKNQISYSRLLEKALGETDVRWRFLLFYRMLEQGYLEIILSAITDDFLQDPKGALKHAEKSISSELEQLKNLVKTERLELFFGFILADLEEVQRYGNRFAHQIITKANSAGGQTTHERGAAAIYAIRCAIAHAGVRDIYYEKYADADKAVGRILATFEEAVFSFLGLNLVA